MRGVASGDTRRGADARHHRAGGTNTEGLPMTRHPYTAATSAGEAFDIPVDTAFAATLGANRYQASRG
jgi:hypothetical protein